MSYTGTFLKGSQLTISYVSQDAYFLSGNLSDYAAKYAVDESLFKAILWKLNFSRMQFDKDMKDFSGDQKKPAKESQALNEKYFHSRTTAKTA